MRRSSRASRRSRRDTSSSSKTVRCSRAGIGRRPRWRATTGRPALRRARTTSAEFDGYRDLFDDSVRLRLRSDVPLGTCLSGGLDSSSIVTTVAELLAAEQTRRPHEQAPRMAFHARFPDQGIDESRFAIQVAEKSGLGLRFAEPHPARFLASVIPVLVAQGEPYGGASINAQFAVMAAAHEAGLKVLLDGQGADELLGGYSLMQGFRVGGLLRSGRLLAAARELKAQIARGATTAPWTVAAAARGFMPPAFETVRALSGGRFGIRPGPSLTDLDDLSVDVDVRGTLLARHLWAATSRDSLPTLLRYEDRNSMAFGLEARVPFLDYRLVEYSVALPDRLRIERGVMKVALRRAMEGRVPSDILRRRDKMGFVAPQAAWLHAGMDEVRQLVVDGEAVRRGWITTSEVERVLARGRHGHLASGQLWRLFITEAWVRMHWPTGPDAPGADTWRAAMEASSAS